MFIHLYYALLFSAQYDETALMHATYEGNIPIMKMLLKHGADKDAKDNEGITVLMQACDRRSQLEAAQLLIDEGADIEARVHKGRFVVGRQAGRQAGDSRRSLRTTILRSAFHS